MKKRNNEYLNLEGFVEGTDIKLTVRDYQDDGDDVRLINFVTGDKDYLVSVINHNVNKSALAITDCKTGDTEFYSIDLKLQHSTKLKKHNRTWII